MNEKARVLLFINGQVQGVFFRFMAKEEAEKLGLTGRVQNKPDGSVEILAEGDKDKLEELIAWCQKGPEHAKVENADATWQDYSGEFDGFNITKYEKLRKYES